MTDPDIRSKADRAVEPPQKRSAAQQVEFWLTLVSLVAALGVIGASWIAAAIPVTISTSFIFLFATVGVWVTVYRLLVLAIRQLVRSRIEQRRGSS